MSDAWAFATVGTVAALAAGGYYYYRRIQGVTGDNDARPGDQGFAPGDPTGLAVEAGISLEQYALARVGQSEEKSEAGRIAVMWATRNMAAKKGVSIAKLVLRCGKKDETSGLFTAYMGDGFFGGQQGRYCSTAKDASRWVLDLAGQILANQIPDPTGGAIQWDAPALQDALHERDPTKYRTSAEVAQRRQAEGRRLIILDGIDHTRFWA